MIAFWIGYMIICWLIADLIAGTFHWWEDQYDVHSIPIVGKLVGGTNADHHANPRRFLSGSYWERNWSNLLPAITVAMLVTVFAPWCALPFWMVSQANEIHAWSHQRCNRVIRALQDAELCSSVKHHAQHHVDPYSRRYCVMSGWLNPVLDLCGYWMFLEFVIWTFTGILPRYLRRDDVQA